MKPIALVALFVVSVLFMGALASPLSVVPSLTAGRTGSELGLFLLLNGERTRSTQSDGGGLLLWTADAGVATVTVTGGSIIYVENPGSTACHLCGPGPSASATAADWDGGCNTTVGDVNYGSIVSASGGQRWISLRDSTTTLKAVPASGSTTCTMPVYLMR